MNHFSCKIPDKFLKQIDIQTSTTGQVDGESAQQLICLLVDDYQSLLVENDKLHAEIDELKRVKNENNKLMSKNAEVKIFDNQNSKIPSHEKEQNQEQIMNKTQFEEIQLHQTTFCALLKMQDDLINNRISIDIPFINKDANYDDVRNFIIQEYNFLPQFTTILTSISESITQKRNQNQESKSLSFITPQFISSTLYILYYFLHGNQSRFSYFNQINNKFDCKQMLQIPHLIQILDNFLKSQHCQSVKRNDDLLINKFLEYTERSCKEILKQQSFDIKQNRFSIIRDIHGKLNENIYYKNDYWKTNSQQRKDYYNDEKIVEKTIRSNCLMCLKEIQQHGDEIIQEDILDSGYMEALVENSANCGGYMQEDQDEIIQSLSNLEVFYKDLISQRKNRYKQHENKSNNLYPALLKNLDEQVEREGGFEEVEAYLTAKRTNRQTLILSQKLRCIMLNTYIDQTNYYQDRQWDENQQN